MATTDVTDLPDDQKVSATFSNMTYSPVGTVNLTPIDMVDESGNIIAAAGPDKYLVSLAVTTSVDQVVAAADATDAIVNGFQVSLPGSPTPAPQVPVPGLPQLPALPHLQGQTG